MGHFVSDYKVHRCHVHLLLHTHLHVLWKSGKIEEKEMNHRKYCLIRNKEEIGGTKKEMPLGFNIV